MTDTEQGRVAKLPEWARKLIERQQMRIEELRATIQHVEHPKLAPKTNIWVPCSYGEYARDHIWKPSPHDTGMIQLGRHDRVEFKRDVVQGKAVVSVWGADMIMPTSGNTFMLGRR